MRIKNVIKRISIFFLVFVVLFLCVFFSFNRAKEVKAEPISIGLGIGALISFLTASGVALTVNSISQQDYASALYNYAGEYSNDSGVKSIQDLENTKNAFNYYYNDQTGEAICSFSDEVSSWFSGFRNWFVQNYALTDSGETIVFSDKKFTTYDGQSYLYYTDFSSFVNGKVPVSSIPLSTDPVIVNCKQGYYLVIQGYEDGFQYGYYRPGVRVQGFDPLGNLVFSNGHRYASETPNNFSFIKVCFAFDSRYNTFSVNSLPTDAGVYNGGGYGFSLNGFLTLNDVTTSQIGLSGSLTDGYDDFEQALNDARSDAGVNGQVAVGAGEVAVDKPVTQEKINEAILNNALTNVGTGSLVGGYSDEKELEEDNDVVKVPTGAQIGSNIVLVNGLEDFFPFCIPFDLYEIINYLNVPAEAPKFNWKMSFANRFDDYDILIDLTPYNTVAVVFRTMIIIVFLIFLTLKTRDLIRG